MNIREVFEMARNNKMGRKKIGGIISVLFFFALFIYFLVNSMASSVDNMVKLMEGMPIARTLSFYVEDDMLGEIESICGEMEHVNEVYPYVASIYTEVEGIEKVNYDMNVASYSNAYDSYIVSGSKPGKNEIVLPHYMNKSTGGKYDDASQYIGDTISLIVCNRNNEKKEYTYKVSGTYDNIYALTGDDRMFVCPEEAVAMEEFEYIGLENELANAMKENNDYDPTHYEGYEYRYEYAVVVDNYENIDKVKRDIEEKIGTSSTVEAHVSYNEMQRVFSVVKLVVSFLVVILLAIVLIMMTLTVGNDIRSRKKEMSMYLVHGYTRKNLIQILGMEYALRFSPVLLISTISTIFVLWLENLGMDRFFSMEYKLLNMQFQPRTFVVGVVILIIVLIAALYNINEQLKKIDLLKEIKSEG